MFLALASTAATHKLLVRRQCSAAAAQQLDQLREVLGEARHEHDALLRRWVKYELEPAAAIDFPAMSDVRVPEISALIKALGAAAAHRNALVDPRDDGVRTYQRAVTALAGSLATAERAAQRCLTP